VSEEEFAERFGRRLAERFPAARVTREDAVSGDVLWAWQSQQPDGSWSIIAVFAATVREAQESSPQELRAHNPELQVLVHRDRKAALQMASWARAHQRRFGQPIRFARFALAGVEGR
jgi:hypothetical protein